MADFSFKLKAEELGKSLEDLAEEIEEDINQAVTDLAHAAYAKIVAKAQAELDTTRLDYIKGLDFEKLDENTYLISLNGKHANAVEDGYSGFDMVPGMLNSNKTVGTGSRAGQKWVRTSAEGKKYAMVPFEKKPYSKSPKTASLNAEIRKLTASNKATGLEQKLTKVFRDESGAPVAGKVATAQSNNKLLDGITKYQHISETGRVSSIYTTFRVISESSSGWNHPGYSGAKFFEDAEKWVEQELEAIIKMLL